MCRFRDGGFSCRAGGFRSFRAVETDEKTSGPASKPYNPGFFDLSAGPRVFLGGR